MSEKSSTERMRRKEQSVKAVRVRSENDFARHDVLHDLSHSSGTIVGGYWIVL